MGSGVAGLIGGSTGAMLGGLISGGLSAAYGAASGATGAAILDAAGYAGYSVLEATKMGAIGNAIIGGSLGTCVGGIAGSLVGCGIFGNNNKGDDKDNKQSKGNFCVTAATHVGLQTLGGLAGWAIMNGGGAETIMTLGKTAAALATGSAVTMIPAACITTCIALPIVLAGVACAVALNNDKDVNDENDLDEEEITSSTPSPV